MVPSDNLDAGASGNASQNIEDMVKPMKRKKEDLEVIPVTVITGFLGSGKTTLLNRLLCDKSHGKRIAVVENEYAVELGVENELLDARLGAELTEVEQVGGACICHGGLKLFAEKMHHLLTQRRHAFDYIVVETTGLADPAFAQIFHVDPFLKVAVRLDSIITVVDASSVEFHLDKEVPRGCVNEAQKQLAAADVVLINKVDLADSNVAQGVEARVRSINSLCHIHRCTYSDVPNIELLGCSLFTLDAHPEHANGVRCLEETGLQAEHADHDDRIASVVLLGHGNADVDALAQHLRGVAEEMAGDLYRVKGVLARAGEQRKFILQGVQGIIDVQIHNHSTWPSEDPASRKLQVVLIGRDLLPMRMELEEGCSSAAKVTLRAVGAKLEGPDPHAMPKGPVLALCFLLLISFLFDPSSGQQFIRRNFPSFVANSFDSIVPFRWVLSIVALVCFLMQRRQKALARQQEVLQRRLSKKRKKQK